MFSATGTYEGGYSYSPYGEARATATATDVTTNTQRYLAFGLGVAPFGLYIVDIGTNGRSC
jgi:hypothetical protein